MYIRPVWDIRLVWAAVIGAVWLSLLAFSSVHAGTTKPEWKKTSDCAVSTSLPGYAGNDARCQVISYSGTLNSYEEFQVLKAKRQFMIVSAAIAGHNTVWRKDNLEAIMSATSGWLDEQEAEFIKAEQRTLPISLWVKRAKHYDMSTKDYGEGCFAFASVGGGAGSGRSAYQLGIIVCNRDGSLIDIAERKAIAASISIKHKLYKEPRSTF